MMPPVMDWHSIVKLEKWLVQICSDQTLPGLIASCIEHITRLIRYRNDIRFLSCTMEIKRWYWFIIPVTSFTRGEGTLKTEDTTGIYMALSSRVLLLWFCRGMEMFWALFGSAQPKSRLHTSHLNDIIHAPHQSRVVSNLHQPTYCKNILRETIC